MAKTSVRGRTWTAGLAVVMAVVSISQPLAAHATDPAPAGTGLTFTDLGAGFYPSEVNDSAIVAGQYNPSSATVARGAVSPRGYRPHDAGGQGVWVNGKLTSLPLKGGYGGGVVTVTDSGVLEGVIYSDASPGMDVVTWHAPYTSASTLVAGQNAFAGDETSGTMGIYSYNSSVVSIIAPTGNLVKTLPENVFPIALNATEFVGNDANGFYLQQIASGNRTTIGFYPRAIAGDGAIVGYQPSGSNVGGLRLADGTESVLPINSPGAIDSNHDVMSSSQILFAGATTPVNATALMPAGWTNPSLTAMSNNGIIVGYGYDKSNALHGFMLKPQTGSITGQVLRGSAPNTAFAPAHAAAGITVTAVGKTSAGASVRATDVTDSSGRYALDTPPGTYTVSFPPGVCASVPGKVCVRTARATVTATASPTVDAVALAALLKATLTLAPTALTLPFDKLTEAAEPKNVAVTLTVKNVGVRNAESVRAPAQLTRSYNAINVVKVPQIPVTQTAGPVIAGKKSAAIGTLAPGKSKVVTYTLRATGDGVYDIEALVVGSQPLLGRVATTGKATLKIGAPVLVMDAKFGRSVRSPLGGGLKMAGSPFTIAVTLENRSYTKALFVTPPKVKVQGNAAGGVFVAAGAPLNLPQSLNELHVSQYFTINPRQTVKAEILMRTSRSVADVQNALGSSVGGTNADVEIGEPVVHEITDDDEVGAKVPANQVFVTGKDAYHVTLDDSSMRVPPEEKTFLGYTLGISWGTMQGLWNLTIGGVIGVWDGLKTLVESGSLLRVPRSVINYMEAEAELWNSIREGPGRAQFIGVFDSALTLAYLHATGVKNSLASLTRSANAALVSHLNTITDEYENGDYRGAIAEMSKEGTEAVGTLVLGTGVLTRWKPAVEALEASKAALFEKFGAVLEAGESKLFIGAAEALTTLKKASAGYKFNFTDLAQYYGLSERQATWLLNFCEDQKIVVTLRSRAAESLELLAKGAVLKAEQIKIKTVNILDAKWLGFGQDNVGKVVLRSKNALPTESELITAMKRAGLEANDAEYSETITRLNDRLAELAKPSSAEGYAAFLENAARKGEITLRWNLEDNSVNPNFAQNGYTKYPIRLASDGSGNRILQFKVKGTWRVVTGDVDLLSIVGANGEPLSESRLVSIYRAIAKSPLGLMHPAADTWTKLERVGGKLVSADFNFPQKINEFVRSGTAAQFAPDKAVRAVTFNKNSEFLNARNYRVIWDGGYNQIAR